LELGISLETLPPHELCRHFFLKSFIIFHYPMRHRARDSKQHRRRRGWILTNQQPERLRAKSQQASFPFSHDIR
jgi:hypothetical protein